MTPSNFFKACLIAGLFLLVGCQATPQSEALRANKPTDIPAVKQISTVPFYPQQQYFCGPTTLAEVFNFYGEDTTADELAPKIFIPKKQGTLQLEMISATRQYGFLPYSEESSLEKILYLLNDDIPVIVFQNLSISLFPQWHYAVVIGYNLNSNEITLHTGVTQNHTMSFELFERTWGRGNYWILTPLPAGKTSAHLDPFKYVSAAFDMLNVGNQERAIENLKAATMQWPEQWLPYLLIGNFYMESEPHKSVEWLSMGYHAGQYQTAYLNNYAHALAKTGCKKKALDMITDALQMFPEETILLKSQAEIKLINETVEPTQCH